MFSLGTSEALREAVLRRRTTQWFASDPVPGELVRSAVAAALAAPAPAAEAGAVPWRFVLLESETARKAFASGLADSVLERAPYLVVPCRVATPSVDAEFLTAALGAAVENLLVTLAADGIASTWTNTDSDAVRELLALPTEWEPLGVIAIGKPAEAPTAQTPQDPGDFITVR